MAAICTGVRAWWNAERKAVLHECGMGKMQSRWVERRGGVAVIGVIEGGWSVVELGIKVDMVMWDIGEWRYFGCW